LQTERWSSILRKILLYTFFFRQGSTITLWYSGYPIVHSRSECFFQQNQVTHASQVLLGSPPIFASTSDELFSRYRIPATSTWVILAFKDRDAFRPTARFLGDAFNSDSLIQEPLKRWLLENRLPTTVELTEDTFQDVMKAPHRPLVVIAAVTKDSKEKVADRIKDIGKVWRVKKAQGKGGVRDVVFAWMDTGKWASWMKSMYGVAAGPESEPAIVIADHGVGILSEISSSLVDRLRLQVLIYYDTDQSGQSIKLTSTSIFSAIDGIATGSVRPKNSENMVQRMARVCFTHFLGKALIICPST